jgi:nucleoside-diphosphate-sugar epimerase
VIGASDFVGSHGTRQLVDRRRRRAGKAERELGWPPEQFHDSIHRAARFYLANR